MKSIFKIFVFLGFVFSAWGAQASPCSGVDLTLSDDNRGTFMFALEQEFHEKLNVDKIFGTQDWYVVYVASKLNDPLFAFFKVDSGNTKYITYWAGAAGQDDERSVRAWAKQNITAIPEQLVDCFVWYVVPGNRN